MAIAIRRSSNGKIATPPALATIAPVALDHEQVVVRRGERSGLYSVIAVHSTVLGPALGGLRIWHYPDQGDALRDAMRLAAGMTLKAAAAGLDLGGGKGVICAPPDGLDGAHRRAALLDFGDLVESLDGRYITAEDVGASPADLIVVSQRTSHLTGLPPDRGGSGDPSPFTAIGVEAAIRACVAERWRYGGLAGRTVCVIGLGHVGAGLARRLADAGCEVIVSDIDPGKRALTDALGATWREPGEAMLTECDVLVPCALGGAITADNVDSLRCEVVCGSANNQLAADSLAEALAERGILYAPDFIANAGGLIHVFMELKGYSEEHAVELAEGIEETLGRVFAVAAQLGSTPLAAARELADRRLRSALRD
ncbi:MAG: leucine dehydrogenase [Solirubrobacterales bacterium]|jgi:leucine dehydrogenase|nr:leucine dehydrogenase [Solirubrobacterales bacterium]